MCGEDGAGEGSSYILEGPSGHGQNLRRRTQNRQRKQEVPGDEPDDAELRALLDLFDTSDREGR
eukprot:3254571-Pyramimonas_sp.AAC.1